MSNLIRLFAFLDEQLLSFSRIGLEEEEEEEELGERDRRRDQEQEQPALASAVGRPPLSTRLGAPAAPEASAGPQSRRSRAKCPALIARDKRTHEPAQARQRTRRASHHQVRINLYQSVSFVALPSAKAAWGPVIGAARPAGRQQQSLEHSLRLHQVGADLEDDEGWILLDEGPAEAHNCGAQLGALDSPSDCVRQRARAHPIGKPAAILSQAKLKEHSELLMMALEEADIELVRASWAPARKEPTAAGVLLFKRLFTKFPKYLDFFPHFAHLDVEHIQENKRLLKHAIKVIETVTFAIDSIGNQTKAAQLNEALINLVRAHLKRKIGLTEFRNLGIVIIDFICELNSGRVGAINSSANNFNKSSSTNEDTVASSNHIINAHHHHQQQQSLTRGQASLAHDDSYSSKNSSQDSGTIISVQEEVSLNESPSPCPDELVKLDPNQLVAAWTKFYTIILDLVRREERIDKEEGGDEVLDDEEEISS